MAPSSPCAYVYKNVLFGIFFVIVVIIAAIAGVLLKSAARATAATKMARMRSMSSPCSLSSSSSVSSSYPITLNYHYTSIVSTPTPPNAPNAPNARITRSAAAKEGFAEEFRTIKNDEYGPLVQTFFSSGKISPREIAFVPSVTDVACVTMTDEVTNNIECSRAHINTLSVKDDTSVNMPGHDTCSSLMASKQPSNVTDADARILNGMYRLYKSCTIVNFYHLSTVKSNGSDKVVMKLSTTDPTAIYVFMNRPIFLATDTSALYRIEYPQKKDIKMYRGLNAEENRSTEGGDNLVDIVLYRVENSKIHDVNNAKNLEDIYGENLDDDDDDDSRKQRRVMHATLFYFKYQSPMQIGSVQMSFDRQECFTLVFPVTTDSLRHENRKWFNSKQYSSPRIRVESSSTDSDDKKGMVTLKLNASGGDSDSFDIDVMDRGYVVIIYTTDLLIMCYMNRERVIMRYIPGVPSLTVDDTTMFKSVVEKAGAQVPPLCYPTTTFSIGNLYDMYTRLVSFS